MEPKLIDMTRIGPIKDQSDGYADFTDNLGSLLLNLTEDHKNLLKKQKIEVLVSKIRYSDPDYPERYEVAKTYTFGYLLRLYRQVTGNSFDLKEYETKMNYRMELFKKEAERRSAWGAYHQFTHTKKLIREEREFQDKIKHLNSNEKESAIKKRDKEKGRTMLYIG